ncbi:MAG TPA: carboxypeptidase-like regulatory domain-containing protein, partial [Bacteroidia bacterium]|nr:carboxypeptidase-like regulatory domain-containing protein [Bacteroidia bacterium]
MVVRILISIKKGLSAFALGAVLLFAALFPARSWAQGTPTVKVYGVVTQNDKKLEGAVVTLKANGSQASQNTTDHSGTYQFVLQLDMNYVLEFTKPGYITKRISFSTYGPSPERRKNSFDDFNFDIDIFPEVPGIDLDNILIQPIGKVVYDPNYNKVGNFNFDANYTKAMQDVIAKLLQAKKAAEAQFKQLVSKADGEFGQKDYTNAKADYTAALLIIPEDSHCKNQLAAIERALKQADANNQQAAQQKAAQAKYDSIIKIADAAFKTPDYTTAKVKYNAALTLMPSQKYPKDQLAAIDKILANKADADKKAALAKAQQAKYDSLIKLGDAAFNSKGYPVAKTNYTAALQVKSDQQYPKDQLAAIDKALASQADADKKAALAKAQQAKYDSLIKLGDAAFKTKDYGTAKTDYTSALQVKSDQQYPKDQLALIDKALAS